MKPTSILFIVFSTVSFYACEQDEITVKKPVNSTELTNPPGWALNLPASPYNYALNEGNDLPTLGRVLFYDPRLSANNTVSCSSCHLQSLSFADQASFSAGFEKKATLRNSMPIQNIVSDSFFDPTGNSQPTSLFWDGRQRHLESMVLDPIQNPIEMGTADLNQLASELSQIKDYKTLFGKAFPFDGGTISPQNIGRALAAFLVSIKSNNSKFDQFLAGNNTLSQLELEGKALFFDKYDCNSCHQLQAPFNGYQLAGNGEFGGFADIGLDKNPVDVGVFRVSGNTADKGKFKIPSLRNVALTSPYMHDGRFETLDEVLNHYSEGIKDSDNLDTRLRQADTSNSSTVAAKQFHIPAADKQAMIAFLNSLTDLGITTDPMFSSPFKKN